MSSVSGAQDVPNVDHKTMHSVHHEMHAAGPAVSFAELRATIEQLNRAVAATAEVSRRPRRAEMMDTRRSDRM